MSTVYGKLIALLMVLIAGMMLLSPMRFGREDALYTYPNSLRMKRGERFQLKVNLKSDENQSVSYLSVDESVAQVDGAGWVTALAPGATEIHLRSEDGAKAAVKVWKGEGYGRNAAGTGRAKEKHEQVYVSFPAARTTDGSPVRGWDYAVRAEFAAGDVVKTLCERCVFSEGAFYAEEDETQPVVCAFNRKDIPTKASKRQKVRFVVTPRSCWGVAGEPIASPWTTVDEIKGA